MRPSRWRRRSSEGKCDQGMYSLSVVESNQERLEKLLDRKFTRYDPAESEGRAAEIHALALQDGKMRRPLNTQEQGFILNEQTLCGIDFRYWAERYGTIFLDGGGVGRPKFWESQEIALRVLAEAEEQRVAAEKRGDIAEGLLMVWHKARQLGATMFSRLLIMHRVTLSTNNRCISASVDSDKILELYTRDKMIYDNLPFFMRPKTGYDTKAEHWTLEDTNASLLYQESTQKTGLGTGRQFEISHFTELSTWMDAYLKVEMDFFPTIPQHRRSLSILESTANGRGNWWHEFSEDVRKGLRVNWLYVFVPWYVEEEKYRRTPPPDWTPSELTIKHARQVLETSAEFCGKRVVLAPEKMYWYETERAAYQRQGTLNIFLSYWCATPLESFQHSGQSAFPPEFLEEARLGAYPGAAYGFEVRAG